MLSLKLNANIMITPLQIEHAAEMFRFVKDPYVANNIGLNSTPTLAKTIAWIENVLNNPQIHAFAINLSGKYVGNVILDCIDQDIKSSRFSIYVGEPSARGRGVGTAATYLAAEYAFNELKLYKVWLTVHSENLIAMRIYFNTGFQIENDFNEDFILDNRYIPAFYMSLEAEQFKKIAITR